MFEDTIPHGLVRLALNENMRPNKKAFEFETKKLKRLISNYYHPHLVPLLCQLSEFIPGELIHTVDRGGLQFWKVSIAGILRLIELLSVSKKGAKPREQLEDVTKFLEKFKQQIPA
jgi:hypothetical protein